jgi:hypothetical protein
MGVTCVVGLLLGACGGSSQAAKPKPPKGDVQAVTYDYEIMMPTTLTPGVHTIGYTNAGNIDHEIVIFKPDRNDLHMPLDSSGDIDEESPLLTKVADSGEPLKPGHSESFETDSLTAGHYVAVCNLSGHYMKGMSLNLTVK